MPPSCWMLTVTYASVLIAGDRLEDLEAVVAASVDLLPGADHSKVVMVIPSLVDMISDRTLEELSMSGIPIDRLERRIRLGAERLLKSRAARYGIEPDRVRVVRDAAHVVPGECDPLRPQLLILGVAGREGDEVAPFVQRMLHDVNCDVLALRI